MKLNKGFTLVELMISMSIIALLSVVLSVGFSRVQKDGRDQRRIEDLKAIQSAAEQYFLLSGSYPATQTAPWTASGQIILQRYPTGPKKDSYVYYYDSVNRNGFCVCSANMESGKYGNAASTGVFPCDFQTGGSYYCVGSQQ